jgi:hypothetical protein
MIDCAMSLMAEPRDANELLLVGEKEMAPRGG